MPGMRKALAAAAALGVLSSGCLMRPGNPYNVGKYPHQWDLPGPEVEERAFGPMASEEVRDFVREMESEGWRVVGYEPASLPEDLMVSPRELDPPAPPKKTPWPFDLPKTMDDRLEPPPKKTIPPYLDRDVRAHRQKYLVIMRRWL